MDRTIGLSDRRWRRAPFVAACGTALAFSLFWARSGWASADLNLILPARSGPSGADTGLDVTVGSQLQVVATGRAEYGVDVVCGTQGYAQTDPDGVRYLHGVTCSPKKDPRSALPSAPVAALIGQIGNGPRFMIGSNATITAAQSGRLVLAYNDVPGQYADNLGGYAVQIHLISAPAGTQPNRARLEIRGLGEQAILSPGQCVDLDLAVRFAGSQSYVDVTQNADVQFSVDPPGGTLTGNRLCAGAADVNHTIVVYGRYRDPGDGSTATGAVVLRVVPATTTHMLVSVPASQDIPGVDTGLDVAIGTRLQLTATGVPTYGQDLACGVYGPTPVDADGARYPNGITCAPKLDARAVLPVAPVGALLGRIEPGPWFLIGSSASVTSTQGGRLHLLFNDTLGLYNDNTGSYSVAIMVQ